MKLLFINKTKSKKPVIISLMLVAALVCGCVFGVISALQVSAQEVKFIKWVNFSASLACMKQALEYDVKSKGKINWVQLLAAAAAKNGGNFSKGRSSEIDRVAAAAQQGKSVDEQANGLKYYSYYKQAYGAILNGLVGSYHTYQSGKPSVAEYGLRAYSPIAYGYGYSHSDDFGNSRSYGYRREHLGNDLMGSVGTPLVAVEDGIVECMGWNRYGGWRIGIRSADFQRYYYYAHLRKNHPYVETLREGMEVHAGQVIGYLGMTGYSDNENHNGMTVPHLHFGIQLIFDESQKDGLGEIWIDAYNIVRLLQNRRSRVQKNEQTGDYEAVYRTDFT